jgi:hypothetical protein
LAGTVDLPFLTGFATCRELNRINRVWLGEHRHTLFLYASMPRNIHDESQIPDCGHLHQKSGQTFSPLLICGLELKSEDDEKFNS